MGVCCAVYGCGTSVRDKTRRKFYRFPMDASRCQQWIRAAGRTDLESKDIKTLNKNYRICELHFVPSDHLKRYLKHNAVPSLNLPQLENDDKLSKYTQTDVESKCCTLEIKINTPSTSKDYNVDVQTVTPRIQMQQKQPKPKPGASAGNSLCNISLNPDRLGLKVSAPETPEGPQPQDLCRFCAEYSKDCVDVTNQGRPYLTRNKTTLTLNDLTVELDFINDALPKTVCGICDRKLQAMYDFFNQVKDAQETLIKVNVKEEIETVIVKTECESPTPKDEDDVDEMDSKDGIIDSLTVTKTVVVKPSCNKRKSVNSASKTQKKPKTESKDIKTEKCELIIDIKEETLETVDSNEDYEAENPENDTETDVKPSVSGLVTSALVNEMSDSETFS